MKLITKLKLEFAKEMNIKFESVESDKGKLFYDGDLIVGVEVWVEDSEGNMILPEDGDYIVGNEKITVKDGIVEVKEENVTIEEELPTDSQSLEVVTEDVPSDETEDYVSVDKFNNLLEIVKEVINEKDTLESKVGELESKLETVTEEFNKATKFSKAKPIEVEKLEDKEIVDKNKQKINNLFKK